MTGTNEEKDIGGESEERRNEEKNNTREEKGKEDKEEEKEEEEEANVLPIIIANLKHFSRILRNRTKQ